MRRGTGCWRSFTTGWSDPRQNSVTLPFFRELHERLNCGLEPAGYISAGAAAFNGKYMGSTHCVFLSVDLLLAHGRVHEFCAHNQWATRRLNALLLYPQCRCVHAEGHRKAGGEKGDHISSCEGCASGGWAVAGKCPQP